MRTFRTKPADNKMWINVKSGTWDELVDDAERGAIDGYASHISSSEWSGSKDLPEALRLARNGWSDGRERLSDLRDALMDDLGDVLPQPAPFMDVSGEVVDVGAYVSGAPEHMVSWYEDTSTARQAHVVVNIATSARHSPDVLLMRGLLTAAIVDSLEHMGVRVTLDVISIQYSQEAFGFQARVKDASQVLDIERVAFACAHPSTLRRIVFASMEGHTAKVRNKIGVENGRYGMPSDDYDYLYTDSEKPDLYIGTTNTSTNLNEVRAQVMEYLKKFGFLRD